MGTILADALVNGKISGGGTTATVMADVSCINSTPKGNISGTISFFNGRTTEKVSFSSSNAFIVATLKSQNSVGAKFVNVTVKNITTGTIHKNCVAFLTATRLTSGSWIGSFSIVCPDGTEFFIFGVFTGSVIVNRQVFCKPLL